MTIEVIKEQLPSYWCTYLIYGDGSGLEPGEEEEIEQTLQQLQTWHGREIRAVDIEGEPTAFSLPPSHLSHLLAGSYCTYIFHTEFLK
tara:strand:+ start:603 stop:866 length:264 start_codon:yes stop_codon:yes gene_type:complete